jgi:hypothetical protein
VIRAAVERDESLSLKFERNGQNAAFRSWSGFAAAKDFDDARVFEDGEIIFHRDFGVVVEPKEWNNFLSVFIFHGFSRVLNSVAILGSRRKFSL